MFGILQDSEGNYIAHTLECPWMNNRPNVSCIPTGEYLCKWGYSQRLRRNTFRVQQVPNRSGILIHPANYAGVALMGLRTDLHGCIALGTGVAWMNKQRCLIGSRKATTEFELDMQEEEFLLHIKGDFSPLEV
jgi:hypothetical protein